MRQVVVLCGGAGTRLRTVVGDRQKCLVDVAGRPFLRHVLDTVARWRVDEVLLLTGHGAEQVIEYVGTLTPPYRIRCRTEASPLGTIGALRGARDELAEESLLVLGDVLPPMDARLWNRLAASAVRTGAAGVMATGDAHESLDQGNVMAEGDLVARYDKAAVGPLIDRGTRYLRHVALDRFPGDSDQKFFGAMVAAGALAHLRVPGPVLDVGTPERLARVRAAIATSGHRA